MYLMSITKSDENASRQATQSEMTQLVLWDGRGEKDYGSKDGLPGFTGSLASYFSGADLIPRL